MRTKSEEDNPSYITTVPFNGKFRAVMLVWVASNDAYAIIKVGKSKYATRLEAEEDAGTWAKRIGVEVR